MVTSTVMLFIIQKLLNVSKNLWRTLDVFSKEKIIRDASRHFLTEPEFVNLLCSPGIDPQPGGPVRQPYFAYRPTRLHRLAESIPWNDSWAS